MRGLVAANRAIVSQLLASYERPKVESRDRLELAPGQQHVSLVYRHVSPHVVRRYAAVVVIFAGLVGGSVSLVGSLIVCVLGLLGLLSYARRKERKRHAAIERDLPALLTSVASSVRAGIDPLRAIADAEEYFPADSPFVSEVRLFKQRIAQGEDEFETVEQLLAGDDHADVELFKRCILLSRRHGSSLADPLHRVVRVVRQRQSFKRKTRAALAMHRMSALGIALCAILIAVMQVAMNSKGVALAFEKTAGVVLLSVGGVLIAVGVCWMLCMGKEEKL
jgi:Flp pilus assembly protein TadB